MCSLAIGAAIASSGDCALAQSKIISDDTLGSESSIVTPNVIINGFPSNQIDRGARRGANLFHSFREFNVDEAQRVYFFNPTGVENILSRVTGGNSSNILGKLGVTGGNANLFLINPNGIIFGAKASLDVGGSFVATTANAIQFGNQGFFSTSAPNELGLLTVNPSALLFNQITAGAINSSSREPAGRRLDPSPSDPSGVRDLFGLRVPDGESLLLVGGNVSLDGGVPSGVPGLGGGLNALGGRVELAGVAGKGTVGLDTSGNNLSLSFPNGIALADISFTNRATVDTSSDKGGGDIQVQGKQVMFTGGSRILTTALGAEPGGNLTVNASDSISLMGRSGLSTTTEGAGAAGDLTINTRKLIVQDGAQVLTSTSAKGSGGELIVNALESVELSGTSEFGNSSGLFSSTAVNGDAGNLTINTRRLLVQDGARISTRSFGLEDDLENFTPATGRGGDLTITTGRLLVQDAAEVSVSSEGTGDAGNLEVTARSISLDNEGKLTATSESGEGGDIKLQDLDLLLLRDDSEISTTARGTKRGGDIRIDTDTLVGLENSDITANAFEGEGGFIKITAQGIFGLEVNETENISKLRSNNSSDISAASQKDPSLNGEVEINRPEGDLSSGLIFLPTELVDVSELIAQGCSAGGGNVARGASKFVATGRGGLPPTPTEALRSDSALADLGTPVQGARDRAATISTNPTNSQPASIVEAQGWMMGPQGEVILIAQAPSVTPHIPWLPHISCKGF